MPASQAGYSTSLLAEQTKLLFRHLPAIDTLAFVCALSTVGLYWEKPGVGSVSLVLWIATFTLFTIIRYAMHRAFVYLQPDETQLKYWRWAVVAGNIAIATLLGYASIQFNPDLFTGQPIAAGDHQAIMAAMVCGLMIASVATYACYFPAFLAAVVPVLAPLGFHMALSDIPSGMTLAIMDLSFMLFLGFAARRINITTTDSLNLQFKNLALIRFLDRSKAEAEALNSKLAREIYERKKARISLQEAHDRLEQKVRERTRELEQAYARLQESEERLSLAIDASDIGLWDWNLETDEVYHSNFDKLLGYSPEDLSGFMGYLKPMVHPDDYGKIKRAIVQHLKRNTNRYHTVYRIRHRDGHWLWLEDEGKVVAWNEEGKAVRMIGTRRDITEQKKNEEQQRLAATVFETAQEAIFILDNNFCFVTVNQYFTHITGYSAEEVIGRKVVDVRGEPQMRGVYDEITHALLEKGCWQGELTERRKNGEQYPEWLQINRVTNEEGKTTHYVGLFSDLTVRREAEEKLKYLSNYDKLTGLANRTLFRDRLHNAITLARLKRKKVGLFYIDLDRFKQINDTLGHEVGDKLLDLAAKRIVSLNLHADTVARIGSDEFNIVVDGYETREELEELANKIISVIRKPFYIGEHELLLGCSIGISMFPETARELQVLVNQADMAMHQAKRLGGNNAQFYRQDLQTATVDQLNLETALRKAIFKNEFVIYYQPKYSVAAERITGVEALVRWMHPTLGLLQPKDFVPLAEETGLISAIGELVLERACRQAHQWHEAGLGNIAVSVNLSAHQMRKGNLKEIVERVLKNTELDPGLLDLELTESLIMEDIEHTTQTLNSVRAMGVSISLDDFGTGYSSLSYLKRFPVDTIKIDRSFISEAHTNSDDAAIVKAIIAMAHSLDLQVIAEGVELPEHLEFLKEHGCDEVQGYLIAKPLPQQEILGLLKSQIQVA